MRIFKCGNSIAICACKFFVIFQFANTYFVVLSLSFRYAKVLIQHFDLFKASH